MCHRMSVIYLHPVIAASRALRFDDHVIKRNGGSGDENVSLSNPSGSHIPHFSEHKIKAQFCKVHVRTQTYFFSSSFCSFSCFFLSASSFFFLFSSSLLFSSSSFFFPASFSCGVFTFSSDSSFVFAFLFFGSSLSLTSF